MRNKTTEDINLIVSQGVDKIKKEITEYLKNYTMPKDFSLDIEQANTEAKERNILSIINATFEYDDITLDQIKNHERFREIVEVRHYFYYGVRKYLDWGLVKIAKRYNRNHTTIIHGVSKVDDYCFTKQGRKRKDFIDKNIKAYLNGEEMDNKFVL